MALRESAEPPSSPLLRSRWFLFLFGMDGRFPKQMDLKDMKNRQSRKAAPSSPRAGNRLRWMIRALSCGDSDGQVHAQAIVKASIGFAV
nr:homeobox protein 9 [Ipomoea batatas]